MATSPRRWSFDDVVRLLERITHHPPGLPWTRDEFALAKQFEPRTAWARMLLRAIRKRCWGRPYVRGVDEDDHRVDADAGIPWRYPTPTEQHEGERAKRAVIRLLFEPWQGRGRPRSASEGSHRQQRAARIARDRPRLLKELQALYRDTTDNARARHARLRQLYVREGVSEMALPDPLRYPPCRVVDWLLRAKARAVARRSRW